MHAINGLAVGPSDRLGLTVFFAAAIHAMVIFGVSFGVDLKSTPIPNTIEVLLLQTESAAPEKAEHIAQANQRASGSASIKNRPTSPMSGPSPVPTSGSARMSVLPTTATLSERTESPVLTARHAAEKLYSDKTHNPNETDHFQKGKTHQQRKLEIAQLTAELAKREQRYSMRPRINYIDTLSAKSAVEATYIRNWVDTVERMGNLNYPDQARRRKLNGSLILHVLLNNDGKVVAVDIGMGSGQQILDDAALRIVTLAAPFEAFPEEMRAAYDQLMITRTWVFQGGDSLITR